MARIHRTVQKKKKKILMIQITKMICTNLETEILESEVLGSIAMNKASGSNGSRVELFQIIKDDAVKVLHSIC